MKMLPGTTNQLLVQRRQHRSSPVTSSSGAKIAGVAFIRFTIGRILDNAGLTNTVLRSVLAALTPVDWQHSDGRTAADAQMPENDPSCSSANMSYPRRSSDPGELGRHRDI